MEIYLIRHTLTNVEPGICYGQTNVSPAPTFLNDKNQVISQLPKILDVVYSSPLTRCKKLALEIISKRLVIDSRLMEMDFGKWEMQSWDKIPQGELNPWMADFVKVAPPGGENMINMNARVIQFWVELSRLSPRKIGVVTHAGVIRLILGYLNSKPLNQIFEHRIDYGEVIPVNQVE